MRQINIIACCLALVACGSRPEPENAFAAMQDSPDPRMNPGYIVDSALSMAEELRRFRDGMGDAPTELERGLQSRDAIAGALLRAAAAKDTVALRELHISRTEFAYLYFPHSKFANAPYELPPGLVWFQLTSESGRGITKLMQKLTNNEPVFERLECSPETRIEENNKFWQNCITYWHDARGRHSARLFGEIIERAGIMKVLSFANDL